MMERPSPSHGTTTRTTSSLGSLAGRRLILWRPRPHRRAHPRPHRGAHPRPHRRACPSLPRLQPPHLTRAKRLHPSVSASSCRARLICGRRKLLDWPRSRTRRCASWVVSRRSGRASAIWVSAIWASAICRVQLRALRISRLLPRPLPHRPRRRRNGRVWRVLCESSLRWASSARLTTVHSLNAPGHLACSICATPRGESSA